jgi:hypothetical protein
MMGAIIAQVDKSVNLSVTGLVSGLPNHHAAGAAV